MKKNKLPLFVLFVSIYFSCKTSSIHLNAINQQSIQMNKEVVSDEEFTKEIEPFKTILDKEMNAVLIVSENEALKGTPESELGNVVTDMVLYKAKQYAQSINKDVDFCMLNNGGLRGSLPKGDINLGKIFELMPFENEIALVTLTGEKTQQLFNYVSKVGGAPMSGVKFAVTDSTAVDIFINGVPFDATKNYTVATSDYLAYGGDKYSFFKNPVEFIFLKHKLRDSMVEYLTEEGKKGNTLKPKKDGRIYKK
ncbi:MAG: 5'-nucleotidase C-terminal domain-containing protein [Bacteroidia bacterium]|jgi:2',3'-cyclic-nucleotide 2'-phosphodiesterase (5'-nucleotidase family)